MGLVGLYRRTGTVSNRYAKFPDDYELVGQSLVDDEFDGHPEILKRRWLCLEGKQSRTKYAFAYDLIDGKYKQIMLHRLAWSLKHGPIDKSVEIDHKNHDGLDNRIENLRPASHHANTCNARLQSNAKTGYKGVDAYKARQSLGGYSAYV